MRFPSRRVGVRILLALLAAVLLAGVTPAGQAGAPATFAEEIAALSEAGGTFDTDNLISNERSYLHAIGPLQAAGVSGGTYLGVGPDQNFSYIAHIRPARAYIVDIRRDNLLLHLLFKALFTLADSRDGYLALLFGRRVPAAATGRASADLARILTVIDGPPDGAAAIDRMRARVDRVIGGFGLPLSPADFATIDRFHRTFIEQGPGLRFNSTGRPPRHYYPTYRELILETDRDGQRRNFLASDEGYAFVRSLQRRDLVIPVVGDLGGTHALAAIARRMRVRGERLSALYTSNVEFYLARNGSLRQFVSNVAGLPQSDRSAIIRAVFPGGGMVGPDEAVPGYYGASIVRPIADLVERSAPARQVRH